MCLMELAAITNLKVFGMTQPEINPTTTDIQDKLCKHATMQANIAIELIQNSSLLHLYC